MGEETSRRDELLLAQTGGRRTREGRAMLESFGRRRSYEKTRWTFVYFASLGFEGRLNIVLSETYLQKRRGVHLVAERLDRQLALGSGLKALAREHKGKFLF